MATRKKTKPDPARDAMMLVEFARVGRPHIVGKKYGVHHSYVQRLWDALSDDEREMYRCQANNVVDFATERLVQEQSDAIHTINERLLNLTMRSLDEYESRISDKLLSKEIRDSDLISFMAKAMSIIQNSTKQPAKDEDDDNKHQNISQVFNILDQSIQTNISQKSIEYDEV